MTSRARPIAFYLPQFHPVPENDRWWGKGFTEWTNVASARPLFRGHYQPHIPADLGFYDLRVPETRLAQAELAREHGIEGFCYWHYWLGNGKRLLERPLEEVIASGEPDLPFCIGWANHTWTGIWFGAPGKTLARQTYPGLEDHKAHFHYLLPVLTDDRYIMVEGRPLIYIYRPREIPDVRQALDLWRNLATRAGLQGLHLVGEGLDPSECQRLGFDATAYSYHRHVEKATAPKRELQREIMLRYRSAFRKPAVFSYREAMKHFLKEGTVPMNEYPSIVPNWDSTPRLGWRGVVLHNATPDLFKIHVRETLKRLEHKPKDLRIVFVKSWNEWGEGNHLEPDRKYGSGHLAVLRSEIFGSLPTDNLVEPDASAADLSTAERMLTSTK